MAEFENAPLRYFFTVIFADNSEITQTIDDKSSINPAKSTFFDVQERSKSVDPIALILTSVDGAQAAVSLQDGHFEMLGGAFFIGEPPSLATPLRLIYFRRNFRHFNMGDDPVTQISHEMHYYFGWQTTTESGENVQRVMVLL